MNIDNMEGLDEADRQEIAELLNVTRKSDSDEGFALVQRRLAEIFYKYRLLNGAIRVSNLIRPQDSEELYEKAQYNIAAAYEEQGRTEEALKIWLKVKDSFPDIYAKAQYNIGVILSSKGRIREAKIAWNNVKKEGNREAYAKAQYNLHILFVKEGNKKYDYEVWDRIEKDDDPEVYAHAQFNLGVSLNRKGYTDRALNIWERIKSENSLEIFNLAQYNICTVSMEDTRHQDIDRAEKALQRIVESYQYERICLAKILNIIKDKDTKYFGNYLLLLFINVSDIIKILKVNFSHKVTDDKPVERKLAHYTGIGTTNKLLDIEKDKKEPSAFRLNTINNVNDPSEGHLLVNYLEGIKNNYFYAPDFDKSLHAFISCFTFNHDSLNQFRLYGKEADKEASGVSLVFEKEFFQSDDSLGGLSFLSLKSNIQNVDENISPLYFNEQSNKDKNSEDKFRINKQPVMRCVYIDPTSDYIQLAHRNKLTFFREFGDETIAVKNKMLSKAEHEWESYKKYIDKKTIDFINAFRDLKNNYELIVKERKGIISNDLESSDKIDVLINEILLPLKYLIKHSAFQEEQECRMTYITSLDAPEVKMVDKKFLFVEYEENVKENLDKVYIAPAARDYQMYLAWLLRDKDIKIDLSNNPFRLPTSH